MIDGFDKLDAVGQWNSIAKMVDPLVLEHYSKDHRADIQQHVAKNQNCFVVTLIELAKSSDRFVRAAVAGNPKTPQDILESMTQDEYAIVRASAYGNWMLPSAIIVNGLSDTMMTVGIASARNRFLPESGKHIAQNHKDWLVRYAFLDNASISETTIKEMTKDSHWMVSSKALKLIL
jgi:hypothetical protein